MIVLEIYKEKTTIQTFDDKKLNRPFAHIAWYNEAQCKRWNEEGAGIFWTINPQEQEGRRGISLTYQFACFGLDCDVTKETDKSRGIIRLSEEEIQRLKKDLFDKLLGLPVKPTIIIETRNGLQPVWVWQEPFELKPALRSNANEKYKLLVKGFTKATGITSEGDQIQRVLRFPGFYHKKSNTDFLIKEIYNGEPCSYEDFIKSYPSEKPRTKAESKPIENSSQSSNSLEDIPVQQALERISGQGFVNGETYSFRQNSNGTLQILVNEKPTSQWIDTIHNTIGGSGAGKGNPTIIQWVKWYFEQKGDSKDIAYAKTYQILYPLLLPHVPLDLWNKNVPKRNNSESLDKSSPEISLPEIDPAKIANALINKDFMNGIKTGYKFFDIVTGGLKRQFSYLVAARSKNLKSMLSVNLLFRVARQNIPVVYFDLENGDFMGNKRLVQIYTGWTNQEMKALEDDPQGEEKVRSMVEKMKQELPFYPVYDLGDLGKEEPYQRVIRMIHRFVEERQVRVVCIDNLNVFTDASKNDQNQYKAQIITAFDAIANELNISVILVHHATDKDRVNEGLKLENFLDNKPMDIFIPHISKTLGTSAAISKTKVGMTMAYDSTTGMLYIWVQTNRDGPQDKRFSLYFNASNKRIYNNAQEAVESLGEIPNEEQEKQSEELLLLDGTTQQQEDDNDFIELDTSVDNKKSEKKQSVHNELLAYENVEARAENTINAIESQRQKIISPTVYFGNQAINELQKRDVLSIGKTTCQKPFKMPADCDHPWVRSEYDKDKYHRVPKKGVKCGSKVFYIPSGSTDICCASCKSVNNLDTVSVWYQTTKRNPKPYIDGWYWPTFPERVYYDSKRNNQSVTRV